MTIPLSRSEQKRRIKEVEKLVRELATLPGAVLAKLPCEEEVIQLLQEAGSLKAGAGKRHLKYITKILKNEPLEELYAFLSKRKGAALEETKQLHELEYLRDTLLDEAISRRQELRASQEELPEIWDSECIENIQQQLPEIDTVALSRLAALFARTRQPRHSREVFRLLRAAREQHERSSKHNV